MMRKTFLFVVMAIFAGTWNAGAESVGTELAQPKLQVQLEGEMGARVRHVIEQWVLTAPSANPGMLEMFRLRDRQPPYESPMPWAGEFAGKYLTSAVLLRRMSDDPRLDTQVREFVAELISTQAEDGYMGPFSKERRLLGEWDLWGHYHVMLGLYLWYQDSGDTAALDSAIRAADLVCNTYLDTGKRVHDAGSHEMNMAVIHMLGVLHRETGDARYLRMMQEIMTDWEKPPAGDYYRQGVAGVEFYQTPKPRWESLHPMLGLGEMYRITGYESYRDALLHFWKSIRRTDIHNAGSFSTNEGAVGNPYTSGAIETCCTVAWLAYSLDALKLSSDPAVADAMELATWNTVLGYEHPSGRWCTYNTPMNGKREASAHTIVFQSRPGTPELNCCSVNGPRGLGLIAEWAVLGDATGLYLNYYGPGEITVTLADGSAWKFVQTTTYPVEGTVRIEVHPPAPAATPLYLRIPAWSAASTVTVNGEAVDGVVAGSYVKVERTWAAGDRIELTLDMTPRAMRGDEHVEYNASLYHGPLLLAYDQKFNEIEPSAAPALDAQHLALRPVEAAARYAPIVLFAVTATDGQELVLCDYASAGAHGTYYRSWLPVNNAPPVAFHLRRPAHESVVAAGDVLMQWSGAGPDAKYTVRIASDAAFKNIVHEFADVAATYLVAPGVSRQDTPLYWDVSVASGDARLSSDNGPWALVPSQLPVAREGGVLLKLAGGTAPAVGELAQATEVAQGEISPAGDAALVFNGTTSRAVYAIGEFPVLAYSAGAWIRPAELPGDSKLHEVISAWCRSSDDPLRLVVSGDQVFARMEQLGGNFGTAGVRIPAKEWSHVAVVKDGAELRLYVNGFMAQVARVPEALETESKAVGVGCNPKFTEAEAFLGEIAGVVVAERAWTDAEVLGMAGKK